jgi:hypothetical protein
LSKQEKYLFRAPAAATRTNVPSRPESAGKSNAESEEF